MMMIIIIKRKTLICDFFLNHEALRSSKNSFKRVRTFQIELDHGSVGLIEETEENRSAQRVKPLGAMVKTNSKLSPHWWQLSNSLATASPLPPSDDDNTLIKMLFLYSYVIFLELTISLLYGLLRISGFILP